MHAKIKQSTVSENINIAKLNEFPVSPNHNVGSKQTLAWHIIFWHQKISTFGERQKNTNIYGRR